MTRSLSRLGSTVLAAGLLLAVASPAFAFQASFKWCSGSPDFVLKDVPKGTAKIRLKMTDLNVPSFRHGGGEVAWSGKGTIACGALNSTWVGPSPPSGSHTYRWSILAIGADGKTLGEATAQRRFPE
ncbi:phospholipid-binding protein [Ancylobacter sp. G4_0304]|uniref:phospholipid-binding protein n=1 Tax=Ancylobacter sp. G4_0304 TaxID=3114289 RepID=UPI0039C5B660